MDLQSTQHNGRYAACGGVKAIVFVLAGPGRAEKPYQTWFYSDINIDIDIDGHIDGPY